MSLKMLCSRMPWYATWIFLASFTGCSCQSENADMANPEAVHQQYNVNFDGGANRTSVTARFRFGGFTGTNLKLNGAARVTHNHFTLVENNFLGVHYRGEGEGFRADHTFEYTDIQGKVRRNSVRLPFLDFAGNPPAMASRAKDLRIPFVGDPIEDRETVVLTLNQTGQQPEIFATVLPAGATEIVLPAEKMARFTDGEATISLERTRSHSLLDATSRGGSIGTSTKTAARKITLAP